jgi:DNA-binding NarL/FixJ family response regulator
MSPLSYTFFEQTHGTHFQVPAGPKGKLPVDTAAAMLAMQCLLMNKNPQDYVVMASIPLDADLLNKANQILKSGREIEIGIKLTGREKEILVGVSQSLSNKQIGDKLCISERTVKFHVSNLLKKYNVQGRMELAMKVRQLTVSLKP